MKSATNTINERHKTHGNWSRQASLSQALKRVMRSAPNWDSLPETLKESLELDAVKTSRILCGNPLHLDSWHDKAGYAALAELEIQSFAPLKMDDYTRPRVLNVGELESLETVAEGE